MRSANTDNETTTIAAVGAIAAILGIMVVVVVGLIVIVSCHKRRKSSAVTLEHPPNRELNENLSENTACDSISNDPHYDNPDDVVKPPLPPPNPPKKKRTYYDEIEFGDDQAFSPRENEIAPVVPSPAVVLSGSLQKNTVNQHSPAADFYNEDVIVEAEHHYSESLDLCIA